MQNTSKSKGIVFAILGIVLALLAGCALYAASTMSFPIEAIDKALFKDIRYDFNGGSNASGKQESSERLWSWENATPPSDVARDGHDLVSWTANAAQDGFQAQWKLSEYAITYDLDYGELSPDELAYLPDFCTIESEPIVLPQPTRYAYTFAGWTLDDGSHVEEIDCSLVRSKIAVHANWERLDFIKSETIYLGDQMTPVHYIYSINSETAPDSTAGVWQGVADVSDGKPTYYIGHNPGVFAPVESFAEGSRFAVCDDNGNLGVYEVMRTIVILYEGTLWTEELERNSMPQGEYATLQTCRGDKVFMDIYVAKRIDG